MKAVISIKFERLQKRLGYQFKAVPLLDLALTHRSVGSRNNERLEFLGDSILNLTIAKALFYRFPEEKEGVLSRLRAQLVKGETLAELAKEFELGACLKLGGGELKSGGHRRDSILADAVEAIIGAIHEETDFDTTEKIVLQWYQARLDEISPELSSKDPKTALQEFLQARKKAIPEYSVVNTTGEDHAQVYEVVCKTDLSSHKTSASASSRKGAEKLSAKVMLQYLLQEGF